jgi:hypothetical protein
MIVARCGYNRHTSRALRYAPLSYAGCGFISWYTLQSEGQICSFLKHWRTDTIISKTLRIALAWSQQWQAGFSNPILQQTHAPIPHLESRWIKSLRQALHTLQGQILVNKPYVMRPERENDIHIMDWVCKHREIFKDNDIRIINYSRLYLHVTTLSELFDAQGDTMLDYSMYQCQRPPWFNPKQYITIQRRPSKYQITKKWKRLCHMWCSPTTLKRLSKISLGLWTHKATSFRPHRQSYIETINTERTQI